MSTLPESDHEEFRPLESQKHDSNSTTSDGGMKPPLPPSFKAGGVPNSVFPTPAKKTFTSNLYHAESPQTPDLLSISCSLSSSSSYDESDTIEKSDQKHQQELDDLERSSCSSYVDAPQRSLASSALSVPPPLASFYPAKYILLVDDTVKQSVKARFLSQLRPHNLWPTAVVLVATIELLSRWPNALEGIREVSSKNAAKMPIRNTWLSFFGALVSQLKPAAVISNVADASMYTVVDLYHQPHAYHQDQDQLHLRRDDSTPKGTKNFLLRSDTIHLIFLLVWCIHHTRKAWDQAGQFSDRTHSKNKSLSSRRIRNNLRYIVRMIIFSALLSGYLMLLPILEEKGQRHNGRRRHETIGKHVSLLELLLLYFFRRLHSTAFAHLQARLVALGLNMSTYAIQNPAKFVQRLRRVLSYIRWGKILAPLFGKCNKLRGHVLDLVRQSKQRMRLLKARTEWDILLRRVSAQRKMKNVLVRMQSSLHEKREKKMLTVIRTMKDTSTSADASTRINAWLCQKAAYARKRTQQANSLDAELPSRKRARQMTEEEKILLVKAKKGFIKTSCANRKMLLRPNTKFSVYWKTITVTCLCLEILLAVLSPKVLGQRYAVIGSSLDMVLLRGTSVAEKCVPDEITGDEIVPKVMNLICTARTTVLPILGPLWLEFVQFCFRVITWIIATVCFLDVFISFWTGEVDDATRKLVVKPFFKRWIIPGVALQLVVNPTMTHVVNVLHKVFRASNSVGFSRLVCIGTVLWPTMRVLVDRTAAFVWEKMMV